jgi:hypothetical protein
MLGFSLIACRVWIRITFRSNLGLLGLILKKKIRMRNLMIKGMRLHKGFLEGIIFKVIKPSNKDNFKRDN